jgi:Family of unknown function (DUF6062)
MTSNASSLPQRDLLDVRLVAAIELGGCTICTVRSRAEANAVQAIVDERVMDIGFRAGLERTYGLCQRHVSEIVVAERRSSGILSSSILYEAILALRLTAIRDVLAMRGRGRRKRLQEVAVRPSCVVCSEGKEAAAVALSRIVQRGDDAAWAEVIGEIPFCLDDLVALIAVAEGAASFATLAERQLARLDDLARRLDAYAHNSAPERRHLMTDEQRRAADEASRILGGG